MAQASSQHGQVLSNGLPVPGATVTATQGDKKLVTTSDAEGNYAFADLPEGTWTIRVTMLFFAPLEQTVTVAASSPAIKWDLKVLPLEQALAQTKIVQVPATPALAKEQQANSSEKPGAPAAGSKSAPRSKEGLLLNGSVNNAASSQFSLAQAFGNTRKNTRDLYEFGLGLTYSNSALDAKPYSLTGQDTPKPDYDQFTGTATVTGPLIVPKLWRHPPNVDAFYSWTRNSNAATQTGLVPTLEQRTQTIGTINPVANALLALYPLPNTPGNLNYNYQIPVLNGTHMEAMQLHTSKWVARETFSGSFSFQNTRSDNTSLFGFRDATNALGLNANISWNHRFANNLSSNAGYKFSRLRSQVSPFFENRVNISGNAGLTGNNQDPQNWGPPTLVFSSGISSLTDAQSSFDRNRTDAVGASVDWSRGRHNVTVGGDFRRQEFNYLSQPNPRGTFNFTGAAFGSDLADFLHGVPDTAEIVYGNADKYLRQSVYDIYGTDDWRVQPDLTLTLGARWEYGAPITELKDRLANIDVAPGFSAVAPVVASDPVGALTGEHYPSSLIRPDRSRVDPYVGLAWRPIAGSSMVIRAGYSVNADTSIYQNVALSLAQQSPFSVSISANNATCSQTLATGPTACSANTADTFGVDPNFRVGYVQTWKLTVQRDLPAALQMIAWYTGNRGLNGVQQFLPNTYPIGAVNPCSSCPTGFAYRTSGGSSSRQEGAIELRRRLRSGLTASLQYTFSKSLDDDSILGGQGPLAAGAVSVAATNMSIAQNWLDLHAERSLSSFDQRHLLNASFQYTTGMGVRGGTLLSGWLGRTYKEWTLQGTIVSGSGLPETPVFAAAVNGTGFTGSIRPDRTTAPLHEGSTGRYLNPAAFSAPQPGQWGDAGRYSVTGPGQFILNSSLARTFRPTSKTYLDVRVDATNLFNHVVFTSYNVSVDPTLTSPIFGLPTSAGSMRSLAVHGRLRF